MNKTLSLIALILCLALAGAIAWLPGVLAQESPPAGPSLVQATVGEGFNYQGRLNDGGAPANGPYDFRFTLYDAENGGSQVGSTFYLNDLSVSDGLFTAAPDFGNVFDGTALWLEIAVREGSSTGNYSTLDPRQQIRAVPYALYSLRTPRVANMVTVAKAGADFTSIQTALDSIADAQADNRYLVVVGPGTYTETVSLKPFVNVQGAGRELTIITAPGSAGAATGTVVGSDDVEVRDLTIANSGGAAFAIPIYNDGTSPRLTNVAVRGSGGSTSTYGLRNVTGGAPVLTDVTVWAEGSGDNVLGIFSNVAAPLLTDVSIHAGGASGENYGIYSTNVQTMTIRRSSATATGAQNQNYGLFSNDSSHIVHDVILRATGGGGGNYGLYAGAGTLNLQDGDVSATGGGLNNHGLFLEGTRSSIDESTITAANAGAGTYGIYVIGAARVQVENSTVDGGAHGIYNGPTEQVSVVWVDHSRIFGSAYTLTDVNLTGTVDYYVGNSLLSGGQAWGLTGLYRCAGVYDESYTLYTNGCP